MFKHNGSFSFINSLDIFTIAIAFLVCVVTLLLPPPVDVLPPGAVVLARDGRVVVALVVAVAALEAQHLAAKHLELGRLVLLPDAAQLALVDLLERPVKRI